MERSPTGAVDRAGARAQRSEAPGARAAWVRDITRAQQDARTPPLTTVAILYRMLHMCTFSKFEVAEESLK